MPQTPKPGIVECSSCGVGEKPRIDRFCYAVARINLLEEKYLPENELLAVNIGVPAPFSPENRYVIHPPGTPGSIEKYLMVELGTWKILFKAEINKIGTISFFAVNLPGYALKRSGNYLKILDYKFMREFTFASFDAGQNWKLITLCNINHPSSAIKCEYDNENFMTRLILPGGSAYEIKYKYGQVQRVVSPSGAITEFTWNSSGFLSHLKTILTDRHPFYAAAKSIGKNLDRKTGLPIVRDIYISNTSDGHLATLTATSGERYQAEYMSDSNQVREVTTGILTYPNGRRDYRVNKTSGGNRVAELGTIEDKNGQEQYIRTTQTQYATSNGTLYIASSSDGTSTGTTYKRSPETLAVLEKNDALGNTTKYNYNKFWQKTKVVYADGSTAQKEYDNNGLLIKEIDECGRVKTYNRNKDGLLMEFKYGDQITKYEYDENSQPIKVTLPSGLVHKFSWDSLGRLTQYITPDNVTTKYVYYGTLGALSSMTITDSSGKQIDNRKYSYDEKGRLIRIDYSDETNECFAYDCCNMTAKRSRSGQITHYAYDANHSKTQETVDDKVISTYQYNQYGRLVKESNAKGTTTFDYDSQWRVASKRLPDGTGERYFRDATGKIIKEANSAGKVTEFKYNPKGEIISIRGNSQEWKDYGYDASGKLTAVTEYGTGGNTPEIVRTTKYEYDNQGRMIKKIYPDGHIEEKKYILGSDLLASIRLNDVYWFYSYDKVGKIMSVSKITTSELAKAPTSKEKEDLIKSKVIETRTYDNTGRLYEKYDRQQKLLARYNYNGNSNVIESVIIPVSDQTGILYTYRIHQNNINDEHKIKQHPIKYVNLNNIAAANDKISEY